MSHAARKQPGAAAGGNRAGGRVARQHLDTTRLRLLVRDCIERHLSLENVAVLKVAEESERNPYAG
jgi:hypothetical protein